jgi:hypothetical protein
VVDGKAQSESSGEDSAADRRSGVRGWGNLANPSPRQPFGLLEGLGFSQPSSGTRAAGIEGALGFGQELFAYPGRYWASAVELRREGLLGAKVHRAIRPRRPPASGGTIRTKVSRRFPERCRIWQVTEMPTFRERRAIRCLADNR